MLNYFRICNCHPFQYTMSSDDDDELFGPSSSIQGGSAAADEELTLPRAAMNKMIKEVMPNIRVANEARELILQCSTEFIHLLSSEANEICDKQQKKTISPEHVLQGILIRISNQKKRSGLKVHKIRVKLLMYACFSF